MTQYIPLIIMIVMVICLYTYAFWPRKAVRNEDVVKTIEPMSWKKPISIVNQN